MEPKPIGLGSRATPPKDYEDLSFPVDFPVLCFLDRYNKGNGLGAIKWGTPKNSINLMGVYLPGPWYSYSFPTIFLGSPLGVPINVPLQTGTKRPNLTLSHTPPSQNKSQNKLRITLLSQALHGSGIGLCLDPKVDKSWPQMASLSLVWSPFGMDWGAKEGPQDRSFQSLRSSSKYCRGHTHNQ